GAAVAQLSLRGGARPGAGGDRIFDALGMERGIAAAAPGGAADQGGRRALSYRARPWDRNRTGQRRSARRGGRGGTRRRRLLLDRDAPDWHAGWVVACRRPPSLGG